MNKLTKIDGKRCSVCSRPQETEQVCFDCERWETSEAWRGVLIKNHSIFEYTDFMKEVLAAFKFRGDAELVKIFKEEMRAVYQKQFSAEIDGIVPIPLSADRLYERGFNQARLLAEQLPIPTKDLLQRTHHEKQSKKSRQERLQSSNVFTTESATEILEKNILLVDDIYTTGTTLRHAAKVLLNNGAAKVSSLTLIRG
ncbi:ComF family protein [Metabacillus herbersteinensis]|uniref:ComF family protein n=1 Tax=Metabacillus herbersteinensis TaxID=283816 RepID=A0ABV6GF62_9BACI